MGLKKRSRVNAEFSMSSLTDIIFLLLIFFMLTANFVQVDNLELPESDSKTVAPTNIALSVTKDGKMKFNGKPIKISRLKSAIQAEMRKTENKQNATLAIAAEKGVTTGQVNDIMKVAATLNIKAILATSPKQK